MISRCNSLCDQWVSARHLVIGIPRGDATHMQAGFLGNLIPANQPNARARDGDGQADEVTSSGDQVAEDAAVARLFMAQQQHLSLPQMRDYNDHSRAGEETDEDFEGNFS